MIAGLNVTKQDLIALNVTQAVSHKQDVDQRFINNQDTLSVLQLRKAVFRLTKKGNYIEHVLSAILKQEGLIAIVDHSNQQQIIGGVIVTFKCKNLAKYTPVWARQIGDICHNVPIILMDDTPFMNLTLSSCVWYPRITSFLIQIVNYTKQNDAMWLKDVKE